jgi:DNA-binding CsgD family transcriptional regulator
MWQPIGITCMLGPNLALMVGVNRSRSSHAFSEDEEAQLVELTQHLQRALQMRRRFQTSEASALAGFATLDTLAFAAVVADAGSRITFANAKAEELDLAGAGLTLGGGRVGCAAQRHSRELNDLIRNAAGGGAGGAMRLTNPRGTGTLLALVAPVRGRFSGSANGTGLALIAVRPEKDNPEFAAAIITKLFGLSRSEAKVVCALAAGASLDEIAAQRGVKITTIKTQIEAAFRKTETESQRDLIRLIGALPPLR